MELNLVVMSPVKVVTYVLGSALSDNVTPPSADLTDLGSCLAVNSLSSALHELSIGWTVHLTE